ncbi:MAG TPA: GNAT family N-acetyltransferase [Candidatus Eisenbacteria bacterium]|nr:GNAT family N-acetyltransferase [Candidatus Eisenbacteria bacterium]
MLLISQVASPGQIAAAEELLREYTAWAISLEPGSEHAPAFEGLDRELATLPGVYAPPKGRLLLATHEGRPAGCVCLRRHDAETGEVKRLYVRPGFRGLNVGRQLIARLLEEARAAGYRRMVLDSHKSMTAAHALYEAAGFRRVSPPDDVPDRIKEIAVFMECELS